MSQAAESSSGQPTEGTPSASTPVPDDPRPGSDIPLRCSLQWDALQEASRAVDAAIALLEERAIAMRNCVLGLNPDVQPWPPAAPGGEYVNADFMNSSYASPTSYRQRQIDQSIAAISAERRRLKDLLRTP